MTKFTKKWMNYFLTMLLCLHTTNCAPVTATPIKSKQQDTANTANVGSLLVDILKHLGYPGELAKRITNIGSQEHLQNDALSTESYLAQEATISTNAIDDAKADFVSEIRGIARKLVVMEMISPLDSHLKHLKETARTLAVAMSSTFEATLTNREGRGSPLWSLYSKFLELRRRMEFMLENTSDTSSWRKSLANVRRRVLSIESLLNTLTEMATITHASIPNKTPVRSDDDDYELLKDKQISKHYTDVDKIAESASTRSRLLARNNFKLQLRDLRWKLDPDLGLFKRLLSSDFWEWFEDLVEDMETEEIIALIIKLRWIAEHVEIVDGGIVIDGEFVPFPDYPVRRPPCCPWG